MIQGRIAQAQGDTKVAIDKFEQAAALQDSLPYMEPPYWYDPVRQSVGAVLLPAGSTMRKSSSDALSGLRRTMVGRITGSWNSIRREVTQTGPEGRKGSSRRAGLAIVNCCNCPAVTHVIESPIEPRDKSPFLSLSQSS